MRQIKFRGYDVDVHGVGHWYYGNLAILTEKVGAVEPGYYISNEVGCPFAYNIRPETVGQFTGITDKNSKEVYEGDIVDVHDTTMGTEDVVRGEVYWCDTYLCWSIQWLPKQSGADSMRLVKKSLKRSGETPSSELGDRRWWFLEVVGNIYEPDRKNGGT